MDISRGRPKRTKIQGHRRSRGRAHWPQALTSFGLKRDQNVFFFAVFNRLGNGTASAVKLCARKFPADTCPDLPTVGLRAVRGSGGALDAPPFDEAHYRCRRRRASRSWPLNFMRWGERRRSAGA